MNVSGCDARSRIGRNVVMRTLWAWPLLLAFPWLASCTPKADSCRVDDDCGAGLICREDACRAPRLPVAREVAYKRATYALGEENDLINAKRITPIGDSVEVGVQPTRVVATSDGRFAVINEATWGSAPRAGNVGTYYLRSVDLDNLSIVDVEVSSSGYLSHGLALVEAAGAVTVFASGGRDERIHAFALSATGNLTSTASWTVPDCYTVDLAVDWPARTAWVSCLRIEGYVALAGKVVAVDLQRGVVEEVAEITGAFGLLLVPERAELYVASLATAARPTADTVTIIATDTRRVRTTVEVGLGPYGMVWDAARGLVWVACNRSDEIVAIDAASGKAAHVVSLHDEPTPLKGMYPVRLTLAADGRTLYVTLGHENAVALIDAATRTVQGFLPTSWYPNDVVVRPGRGELVLSIGRGAGDGPTKGVDSGSIYDAMGPDDRPEGTQRTGRQLRGALTRLTLPTSAELTALTVQVADNNDRQRDYFDFSSGNDTPLPSPDEEPGARDEIRHVFFILKENFSYDAAWGDFERGVGNPDYVMWTEAIIPNQRSLGREFTLFDNFYCEADSSLDGHQWAAAGIETELFEKFNWHSADDFGTPAVSLTPGSSPESQFLMPHLLSQGIDVLGFGGTENFGADSLGKYLPNLVAVDKFPPLSGDDVIDTDRAAIFVRELAKRVEDGTVPGFSWIFLGDNHGHGLHPGVAVPEYWVGMNDQAVGMVVEAIAASPIWKHSLIFIAEDDAQAGYDHVDKHRCPALAIGPWVKRGYTSSIMYTINNFHRTVGLLLGSTPMHRLDARAAPMADIFEARADTRPWQMIRREVPATLYEDSDHALTAMSASMDWSDIDRNPDTQAELYWRWVKKSPPPRRDPLAKLRPVVDDD
jgi:YVTN family beta-propeller protein